MLGIEGVFDLDGNVLDTHRINRRRINDLGSEVTQLHGLNVAEFVDGISGLDDAWVSRHKAVYIGPDLQDLSVKGCGNDACRIVATASSEVGCLIGIAVAGDKSGYNTDSRQFGKGFSHQLVGQC